MKMLFALPLILFLMSASAASASGGVGVDIAAPAEVQRGGTVEVRVSFSGEKIFGVDAVFGYDDGVLRFVGGDNASDGRIVLIGTNPDGHSRLETTLIFEAIATGMTQLRVECTESFDIELRELGTATVAVTITVSARDVNPAVLISIISIIIAAVAAALILLLYKKNPMVYTVARRKKQDSSEED